MRSRFYGTWLAAAVSMLQLGTAAATDVTSQVTIAKSGLTYARATNTFNSVVTVTNNSGAILAAPFDLVITGLTPATVTLANASGQDPSGRPYLDLGLGAAGLAPGQSLSGVLRFNDPSRVSFSFGVAAISGNALGVSSSAVTLSIGDAQAVSVTLPAAAGPDGVQLSVVSSDPTVATVPATVTIPAGSSTGYFGIDAVGQGGASVVASAPGGSLVQLTVAVQARDFAVTGVPVAVAVGQTAEGEITLNAPAPIGGANFTVASAAPGVVNVLTPTISIAAGELQGSFSIQGIAAGSAGIGVSGASGEQGTQSVSLTVRQSAGSATITSGDLIDQATASGALSADQAVVYQTLAQFGSAALPSQYQGRPASSEFEDTTTTLGSQLATLSADEQATVAPYLIPPIYSNAWQESSAGASTTSATSTAGAASAFTGALRKLKALGRSMSAALTTPAAATVSVDWAQLVTPHFRIWYRTAPPANLYTADQAAQAALNIAAYAEDTYAVLSSLLQKELLSDAGQKTGNGGDGLYDIYVVSLANAGGMTVPYDLAGSCSAQPSYILVDVASGLSAAYSRHVLPHEMMHAFQFTYNRQGGCASDQWLMEATATWAEYYVNKRWPNRVPTEHVMASEYFGGGDTNSYTLAGSGDPRRQEFRFPLDQSARSRVACKAGYCDYVFFLYLSNTQGDSVIPGIFGNWGGSDAVGAINATLNGSLNTVWNDYAQKLWNEWQTPPMQTDFLTKYDPPKFLDGIFSTYENHTTHDTINVALNGQRAAEYKDQIFNALSFNSVPGETIYRLSASPLYFTFNDPSVSYVVFANPLFKAPVDKDFKIYTRARINGQWEGSWTDMTQKDALTWCRDKKTERINELAVIVSNGNTSKRGLVGQSLGGGSGAQAATPDLLVSNVGCWQWKGTASATVATQAGLTSTGTAKDLLLQRDDAKNAASAAANGNYEEDDFSLVAGQGTANMTASGNVNLVCSVTEGPLPKDVPLAVTDATLGIHMLGAPFDNFTGEVLAGTGRTQLNDVPYALVCAGQTLDATPKSFIQTWMGFPGAPDYKQVSPDGHSISGSYSEPADGTGAVTTYHWELQAVVEQ